MVLLFVVNDPEFFLSHRLPLAIAAREAGFDVQVATALRPACDQIVKLGFVHHPFPLSRSGCNPLVELRTLWALYRLLRKVKPSIVHLVTIKPVLYGGLTARLAGVQALVAAVAGLGTVFVARGSNFSPLRLGVRWLYRLALRHRNLRVIFQNPEDRSVIVGFGAVRSEQTALIKGSGVVLSDYPMRPEPVGTPVVTFAARLLKDKGVVEFVEAARLLRNRAVASRFWLVGVPDPGNVTSINDTDVEFWRESGLIEPLGYRNDIAEVFANSNVVVLPSYYGEGLPKVLIEAAACGRVVITTDRPGCRDAIEPNVTGLLVPPRNAAALADAIERLIQDAALRRSMGKAGRALAEREFGIEKVIDAHLRIYNELLNPCASR